MPHYYFPLTDGKQVLDNHKGMNLAGDAAARDDAMELARDIAHRAAMPNRDRTGWFVAIVDEEVCKVDEMPLALPKCALRSPHVRVPRP
jgi:hypothetical protein